MIHPPVTAMEESPWEKEHFAKLTIMLFAFHSGSCGFCHILKYTAWVEARSSTRRTWCNSNQLMGWLVFCSFFVWPRNRSTRWAGSPPSGPLLHWTFGQSHKCHQQTGWSYKSSTCAHGARHMYDYVVEMELCKKRPWHWLIRWLEVQMIPFKRKPATLSPFRITVGQCKTMPIARWARLRQYITSQQTCDNYWRCTWQPARVRAKHRVRSRWPCSFPRAKN